MTSSYYLAVDVGTSRTAAATARLAPDGSLLASSFALGRNSDSAPTAMFVSGGDLLFGDVAERRGITEPERLVREFKRRIGDDVPIIAGDERFTAEEIYALMVGWVVDLVSEREARLPTAIAVTVPAAWGEYRTDLVEEALARHGWGSVTLVTEPEAAARHYESTSPLPLGRALAVYDLGGGTFDAVVLQKDLAGEVQIAGTPVGLDDVGGSDFDDAVMRHALAAAGIKPATVADERMALTALRRECVEAKESLSFDSETVIPVLFGSGSGAVRLTRDEFEAMIEQLVDRTIEALSEALEYAAVDVDEIESILLTGGSSRIPHIAQVLSDRFDRPIAVDADPKAIIALGAVRVLSDRASAGAPAAVAPEDSAFADEAELGDEDAAHTSAVSGNGRGKGRRWRLPAFAYLSAGSLVLALGLVVASATAVGYDGLLDKAEGGSFLALLSTGLSGGAADAAELPQPASQPQAPVPGPAKDSAAAPATPAQAMGRRTGPKAATSPRAAPPASSSWAAAHPTSSVAPPASTPATTPMSVAGSEPTSDPTPTVPPADPTPAPADPTPSEPSSDPSPEPTPTETPANATPTASPADPTPTDPPPADPASDTGTGSAAAPSSESTAEPTSAP